MKWCCFYTIKVGVGTGKNREEIGIVEASINWVGNICPRVGEEIAGPNLASLSLENARVSFRCMGKVTKVGHDHNDIPRIVDGELQLVQTTTDVAVVMTTTRETAAAAKVHVLKLHQLLANIKGIVDAEYTLF